MGLGGVHLGFGGLTWGLGFANGVWGLTWGLGFSNGVWGLTWGLDPDFGYGV